MKFSVCVPNYNYAAYVAMTVESVLAQRCAADVEVLVADNASTDGSVAVVQALQDSRVRISSNRWNVGFAANLDRACRDATGDWMILLSSDDLMLPGALAAYERLLAALGDDAANTILSASQLVIDGDGAETGRMDRDPRLWKGATRDDALSAVAGAPVWSIAADRLLHTSLANLRTPLHFAATCYSRALYDAVEGYAGARGISPDKHFAWKAMTVADRLLFVEQPLFAYRVHGSNQLAQQARAGALKHIADQYAFTYETAPATLERAGVSRDDLARAFVKHDIGLRGLKLMAEGRRDEARRHLRFGQASFPALMRHSREVVALRILLALGPLGTAIARNRYERAVQRFRRE